MRIKGIVRRLLVSLALVATVAGGAIAVTESPALAAGTSCKTLNLNGDWWTAINPHMSVPICYNGSSVWQSGPITPGVTTYGYNVNSITWYGTYGSGGWLGAGENFSATAWGGWATFWCSPRWGINAWGNVISYSRNC
jgi:uncharacterized RDD family membrane protein YckC